MWLSGQEQYRSRNYFHKKIIISFSLYNTTSYRYRNYLAFCYAAFVKGIYTYIVFSIFYQRTYFLFCIKCHIAMIQFCRTAALQNIIPYSIHGNNIHRYIQITITHHCILRYLRFCTISDSKHSEPGNTGVLSIWHL